MLRARVILIELCEGPNRKVGSLGDANMVSASAFVCVSVCMLARPLVVAAPNSLRAPIESGARHSIELGAASQKRAPLNKEVNLARAFREARVCKFANNMEPRVTLPPLFRWRRAQPNKRAARFARLPSGWRAGALAVSRLSCGQMRFKRDNPREFS